MKAKIEKTLSYFDTVKRGEDTITILKDNAPEALNDSIRKAHGERLPDDWIFAKYVEVLEVLEGYDLDKPDSLADNRHEIVDGMVDVYTSGLTAWLNSHNDNVYYLTEAQEEFGPIEDGLKLLAMAQYKAIDEIYSEVVSYLESI
jgi:hypothetical protein